VSLNSTAFNGARTVGPAIAGVLVAAGRGVFRGNAASYAAVLAALLAIGCRAPPGRHEPFVAALRGGCASPGGRRRCGRRSEPSR
jgi:hypothetical protein